MYTLFVETDATTSNIFSLLLLCAGHVWLLYM